MSYQSKAAPLAALSQQPQLPAAAPSAVGDFLKLNFSHWLGNWLLFLSLAGLGLSPVLADTPKVAGADFWSYVGMMGSERELHTFTRLNTGQILVVGGSDGTNPLASVELYDSSANLVWISQAVAPLTTARFSHSATLLANGKVLVVGGSTNTASLSSAELYNPTSKTWSDAGSMATARSGHTATLLATGKVLVTGGTNGESLASSELYDPATNAWTATGNMTAARENHTATKLSTGQVLVSGGYDYMSGDYFASAELYNPSTGTWATTGAMATARKSHTATLLNGGKVLVTGGVNLMDGSVASTEVYDPAAGSWSDAGVLSAPRNVHTATLLGSGKVLVAGGYNDAAGALASVDVYDPSANTWSATAPLSTARRWHAAIMLLPNGKVLIAGGLGNSNAHLNSAEVYDPSVGTWASSTGMGGHYRHTATRLTDGRVLVVGGSNGINNIGLDTASLYDPATGAWTSTASINGQREWHAATPLANGKALITGGVSQSPNFRPTVKSDAQLYDHITGTWISTGSMTSNRAGHTATTLLNGKVLVTGGWYYDSYYATNYSLSTTEIYDPATGIWTVTGSMTVARRLHVATRLANGLVLVTGGRKGNASGDLLASAELYDPTTGAWRTTGSMTKAREMHSATLLANRQVLVVGGGNSSTNTHFADAELFNLVTGQWTAVTATPNVTHGGVHRAVLLNSGLVLVVGGYDGSQQIATAELFDPSTSLWSNAATMATPRENFTATLLTDGKVLVAGGWTTGKVSSTSELYNPGPTTAAPSATTAAATNVTLTSATLNGTVNDNGAATTVTFDFGSSLSYGTSLTATPASLAAGSGSKTVTATKTGLVCNTLYHYRVTAVNSIGTTNGADQSFTTAICPVNLPIATTNAATNVAVTSATLNGSVTSAGATATASFELGTSTSYGETVAATPSQIYSSTAVAVSASKTGLVCNTAYNFRAKAVTSAGTGLGNNQTFTTAACAANSWLTPPTSTVPRDQPFALNVVVKSDGMKVSNYEFAVTLDPTKLQFDTTYQNAAQTCYLGVCPGTSALINRNVIDTNLAAGTILLTGQDATGQGPGNDLQLVVIHFKTKTTTGATPVALVTNKLTNPSGGTIGLVTKGATVNVSYGICGDADGNNAVNIVDALSVARKVAGLPPPPTIDELLTDTNKNSRVDIGDALFIARYAVGLLLPPESCAIGVAL